jgi:GR25 family glycosyltransferase involved in LPS biosynthesis
MKYLDNIELIYYINLDHRQDRLDHIKQVISDLEFDPLKVFRISGTYIPENGSLGCAISHVEAIENFLSSKKSNCLVLEDDFNFYDKDRFISSISSFFQSDCSWDIIQLSSNLLRHEPTSYKNISRVLESQTTSGYLLNSNFAKTLLDCFIESKEHLLSGYILEYCIDQNWKKLQEKNKWFCFNPQLGYQIDGYSDIENEIVSYKC